MNISISIPDTHKAVQALEAKGHSKAMAEGIVEAVQSAKLSSEPATQADLAREIGALRSEMYRALTIHGFTTVGTILAAVFGVAAFFG
ncbi:hypothetical protein [uncultured Tateyamaria sp.]|uniref:hypothetical protein n=1 Tax=uncultured Tateyamaria sp. TaxID=455651 RepID=UPI002636D059|nr:hypothetical protein [uncultured Tateyamaria sp.]